MNALWRAARPATLMLPLSPFVLGALVGNGARGFDLYGLALALIATVALHVAANWINDWRDAISGADALAAQIEGSHLTATGALLSGEMTLTQIRNAALLMLGVGSACAALLIAHDLTICAMGVVIGGVLALGYTAPPLRLAYHGRGLGEIAAIIGYGVLPAMVAQASQGVTDGRGVLIGAPLGLLAASLLLMHDYLHPEADRQAGKHTPVVAFGARAAWIMLGGLLIAAYTLIIAVIVMLGLSMWTSAVMITALPLGWAWINLRPPASQKAIFTAIQYATQTHVIVTVGLIMALIL